MIELGRCIILKKTNFVVVFWLILSLVSFITFLVQLSGFWRNVASLIIPYNSLDYSFTTQDIQRNLLENIPMLIIAGILFIFFLKKGLKLYRTLSNKENMADEI